MKKLTVSANKIIVRTLKRMLFLPTDLLTEKIDYNALGFIHQKRNFGYESLFFDPRNREPNEKHIKKIMKSVDRNDNLRDIVVVWVAELNKFVIIDGQHLAYALMRMERPIEAKIKEVNSDAEMITLIKDMNTTSRGFKLPDFIHIHSDNADYKFLESESKKSGIALTVFIMAYTLKRRGISTDMTKEGIFKITDKKRGNELIKMLKDCNQFLPNDRVYNEAMMNVMLSNGNYDNAKMLVNLKVYCKVVVFSTKEGALYQQLDNIYKA